MSEEELLAEADVAHREHIAALHKLLAASDRREAAREALAKNGLLDCEACTKKATKRYRCNRWFCSKQCHELVCYGPGVDVEPAF